MLCLLMLCLQVMNVELVRAYGRLLTLTMNRGNLIEQLQVGLRVDGP